MKRVYKASNFTDARNEENLAKNRNPDVVPTNANRVRLMTLIPSRNDYINAVFLDVSPSKNVFGSKWAFLITLCYNVLFS